ncbi:hypothetical protein AGMMS4957_18270 [Bacteroidia bacterium]|nr:hypothetical protein AGMMS4957_18270 [Bacteroidia bacterium]
MKGIEGRFLIYEELPNDAPLAFNKLLEIFSFKMAPVDIYGVYFSNNRCKLGITSETGSLQIWLTILKYNISEMIPKLCMFKGEKVYEKYKNIVLKNRSKEQMEELSDFLIEYFAEELKQNDME